MRLLPDAIEREVEKALSLIHKKPESLTKDAHEILKKTIEQATVTFHFDKLKELNFLDDTYAKNSKVTYKKFSEAKLKALAERVPNNADSLLVVKFHQLCEQLPDVSDNEIDRLRMLAQGELATQEGQLAYDILVALAEYAPRNEYEEARNDEDRGGFIDPISFEGVKVDQCVPLSTGYVFDLGSARACLETQQDPMSALPLSQRDCEAIKSLLFSEQPSLQTLLIELDQYIASKEKNTEKRSGAEQLRAHLKDIKTDGVSECLAWVEAALRDPRNKSSVFKISFFHCKSYKGHLEAFYERARAILQKGALQAPVRTVQA